ncbi:hypothetical protein BDF19DRAFT_416288 [Syncephalis fuscata]|nr:hypothetical protein BDF19DRAFT_416288 [Syncephalis fuscata]
MIKTCFFTLATACSLAILISVPESHADGGRMGVLLTHYIVYVGPSIKGVAGRDHLEVNAADYGLSEIDWKGGDQRLSINKAKWQGNNAVLKCGIQLQGELVAFKMLKAAIPKLKVDEVNNVMIPLSEFPIPGSEKTPQGIVNCFVYKFIDGITLEQFFINNPSFAARAPVLNEIFAHIFKGVTVLHKAGLLHKDLNAKNIMVPRDFSKSLIKAIIIDYDLSIPIPSPGVDCSIDNKGMSPLINQALNSGFLLNQPLSAITKALADNLPNNLSVTQKTKITADLKPLATIMNNLLRFKGCDMTSVELNKASL